MNIRLATLLLALAGLVACDGTTAVSDDAKPAAASGEKYARVISVVEVKEVVKTPRQECKEVVVKEAKPSGDDKKILGTVAGAVVGGVLGNQIGGGTGKTLATVAGATGGALAGRKIQEGQQQKKAQPEVEKKCTTVEETSEKILGYDVTYRLDGKEGKVRMSSRPGDRIPVKDGKLVVD